MTVVAGVDYVADCELVKWQLRLDPGEIAHYNFPAPSINWEVLPQSSVLPAATIAVVSSDSNGSYRRSKFQKGLKS